MLREAIVGGNLRRQSSEAIFGGNLRRKSSEEIFGDNLRRQSSEAKPSAAAMVSTMWWTGIWRFTFARGPSDAQLSARRESRKVERVNILLVAISLDVTVTGNISGELAADCTKAKIRQRPR